MGRPGFYDDNRHRAYPFVARSVGRPGAVGVGGMPHSAVVDAGFTAGPSSGFVPGQHHVALSSVSRSGQTLSFAFTSDAPGLSGVPLVFTRDLADARYAVEHRDSDYPPAGSQGSDVSEPAGPCALAGWWGFLVTGDLGDLADWLGDGQTASASGTDGRVEPGAVQSMAGAYVESVSVANADRTRAEAPAGCEPYVWPFTPPDYWVWQRCVRAAVRFDAGYNAVVQQDPSANAVTFGARPGAGAGRPCGEVRLGPPESGPNLAGGPGCGDVLRSVNGVPGPDIDIRAGAGVSVSSGASVSVDVGMQGLAACARDTLSVSESL